MLKDDTTLFMKGALLGYCQTHEPEEIAELFDDVFLTLNIEKAANISAAISARYLCLMMNDRNENEVNEFIKKHNEV